nr:MAG TPA: hypothetical protein [Caudoviricetes sp.]
MFTLHNHSYTNGICWWGLSSCILEHTFDTCDVQFVHHRNTSVL